MRKLVGFGSTENLFLLLDGKVGNMDVDVGRKV